MKLSHTRVGQNKAITSEEKPEVWHTHARKDVILWAITTLTSLVFLRDLFLLRPLISLDGCSQNRYNMNFLSSIRPGYWRDTLQLCCVGHAHVLFCSTGPFQVSCTLFSITTVIPLPTWTTGSSSPSHPLLIHHFLFSAFFLKDFINGKVLNQNLNLKG